MNAYGDAQRFVRWNAMVNDKKYNFYGMIEADGRFSSVARFADPLKQLDTPVRPQ
jgi:hypothetical protein